ncbi:MAG: hypothetical protein V1875_08485 [Candidatus Altiarchaeota archaeon]
MVKKRPLLVGGALFSTILAALSLLIVGLGAAYAMDGGRSEAPATTTTSSTSSTATTSSTSTTTLVRYTTTTSASTTLEYRPPQSTTTTTYVSHLPDYTKYGQVPKIIERNIVPDSCYKPQ